MEIFTDPTSMRAWSFECRTAGLTVALVPTLGALHDGHLALIAEARRRADSVIVSIFVNPLQFDRTDDFERYPRPIDADLTVCRAAAVDAVYAPSTDVMYPPRFDTRVVPGDLSARLEGPGRPGHFEGVTTVVAKLFGAAVPDFAMFGQKDFQQLAIVRRMVADLDMGIEIVGVPTVRERDGLAGSSRNARLDATDREAAVVVPGALDAAAEAHAGGERQASVLREIACRLLDAEPRARVEYIELVDADTLLPLERIEGPAVIALAVWFGDVRLIDNRLLS